MKSLGVVGTGLIGASIGLRARDDGMRVLGSDASADAAARALALGAIDAIVERAALYATCSEIVLAMPPEATCCELRRLRGLRGSWRMLIDVASVKRPVVKASAGVASFVATHPLAGRESSGPGDARADLFEARTWAYAPSANDVLNERVERFIRSLGAVPYAIGADEHDAIVALTSHLPQLVALLLAPRIRESGFAAEMLCGPAGREILRLGQSNPDLWREVLEANADYVAAEAETLARELLRKTGVFSAAAAVDAANGP